MPVELLVILGAEAAILGFVAAMSLHTKRMDVLSGRSFRAPHRPSWRKQASGAVAQSKAHDLLRFTGSWAVSSRSLHPISWMLRRIFQIRLQTPVRIETPARWTGTPASGACDRPPVLSSAGRDAQGKGAGPEHMQSSAASILHQLSAP